MSSILDALRALPIVFLWLFSLSVALGILAYFFTTVRRVLYRLMQTGLVVLLLFGTIFGTYFLFFDRCETLAGYKDGSDVRLIGVCREVEVSPRGAGRRASFVLRDPTGSLRVVTTTGAPSEGSLVYLRGRKGTFDGTRTFVVTDYRFSPY